MEMLDVVDHGSNRSDGKGVFLSGEVEAFVRSHPDWYRAQMAESDTLYAFPRASLDQCLDLFKLDSIHRAAERDFAAICDIHRFVGVIGNRPIRFFRLFPARTLNEDTIRSMSKHGWPDEVINQLLADPMPTSDVDHRMEATIGRIICNPQFAKDVESLREEWKAIPEADRPTLPLRPPARFSAQDQVLDSRYDRSSPFPQVRRWWERFEEFSRTWEIAELHSWDLPEPRGPHWPSLWHEGTKVDDNLAATYTPVRFPVLDDDGLGSPAMEQHRARQAQLGIDDDRNWQTYAQLFKLKYWQTVLLSRYSDRRCRAFKTSMELVLSQILDVSLMRLQTLRKRLSEFDRGSISSLHKRR